MCTVYQPGNAPKLPTISEAGITIDARRSWVGYTALQQVLSWEKQVTELSDEWRGVQYDSTTQ